jgi:uncharacterized OB-fold protein
MSDHSFEQFLSEERLMGGKCAGCGALFVPPRAICRNCYGTQMEWVEAKGTGKLAGFTCIHIGPPAMALEGYDRKNPYCAAAVELDEGPRVVARVEGIDALQPQAIAIGTQLQVSFLHLGEGDDRRTILAFRPT